MMPLLLLALTANSSLVIRQSDSKQSRCAHIKSSLRKALKFLTNAYPSSITKMSQPPLDNAVDESDLVTLWARSTPNQAPRADSTQDSPSTPSEPRQSRQQPDPIGTREERYRVAILEGRRRETDPSKARRRKREDCPSCAEA